MKPRKLTQSLTLFFLVLAFSVSFVNADWVSYVDSSQVACSFTGDVINNYGTDGFYLYNDTSNYYFNETSLNSTIVGVLQSDLISYEPNSIEIIEGTYNNGNLASIQTLNDNLNYSVQEQTGVPGYDIRINFTNVIEFNEVRFNAFYDGSSGHEVQFQLYNYNTSTWDNVADVPSNGNYHFESLFIANDFNYVENGIVQSRFYHLSSGSPQHRIDIDFINLRFDRSANSITVHSQLSGLDYNNSGHTGFVHDEGDTMTGTLNINTSSENMLVLNTLTNTTFKVTNDMGLEYYQGADANGFQVFGFDDKSTSWLKFALNSAGTGSFSAFENMAFFGGQSGSGLVRFYYGGETDYHEFLDENSDRIAQIQKGYTEFVDNDMIVNIKSGSPDIDTLNTNMSGLELTVGNVQINDYGLAVKWMTTDGNLATENPKLVAHIVTQATESITSDLDGGTDLVFGVTPDNTGANNVPVEQFRIVGNGGVEVTDYLYVEDLLSDNTIFRLKDSDGTCDAQPEAGGLTWSCSSERELKEDIVSATNELNKLKDIDVREYTIRSSDDRYIGVIADEIELVRPDLIKYETVETKVPIYNERGELIDYEIVSTDSVRMVSEPNTWELVKAIQELNDKVNLLETELNNLKNAR